MKTRLALTVALCSTAAAAQPLELPPIEYPELPRVAQRADEFVPAGWTIVARRSGDLNGDGKADVALLLKLADPANILSVASGDEQVPFDTNPHWLLVAFAEGDHGYRLAADNRGLFPRRDVPFTGDLPPDAETIRIERGSLVLFFEYLRTWSRWRFRWQDNRMALIGYDEGGASGGCVATTSINFLTRQARLIMALQESARGRVVARRVAGPPPPDLARLDEAYLPTEAISGSPLLCQDLYGDEAAHGRH